MQTAVPDVVDCRGGNAIGHKGMYGLAQQRHWRHSGSNAWSPGGWSKRRYAFVQIFHGSNGGARGLGLRTAV